MYLVYKQPGKYSDAEHGHLTNTSPDKRNNFKIADFAKKHNLGNPVAGNFYQVEKIKYCLLIMMTYYEFVVFVLILLLILHS